MYCKNCGKEIPRQAAFCPHCGAKNTPHANTQTTAAPTGTPPRRHRRWWLVVLSVLIVLAAGAVILIGVLGMFQKASVKSEDVESSVEAAATLPPVTPHNTLPPSQKEDSTAASEAEETARPQQDTSGQKPKEETTPTPVASPAVSEALVPTSTPTPASAPTPTPTPEPTETPQRLACASLYADMLENSDYISPQTRFQLADLNSDGVPELLVAVGGYHISSVEIFTIVENQVVDVGACGEFGMMAYEVGGNLLLSSNYAMGNSLNTLYALEDGALVTLHSYNQYYTMAGDPNMSEEERYRFEVDGNSVSKEQYRFIFHQALSSGEFYSVGYDNGFEVTASAIELMREYPERFTSMGDPYDDSWIDE